MKPTAPFAPVALVLAAAVCLGACTHIDPKRARPVALTQKQMVALKTSVAEGFADPKKVQFRNIQARDNFYPDGTVIRSVCGEVNGTTLGTETGFIGFTRNLDQGKWVTPPVGQPCY